MMGTKTKKNPMTPIVLRIIFEPQVDFAKSAIFSPLYFLTLVFDILTKNMNFSFEKVPQA